MVQNSISNETEIAPKLDALDRRILRLLQQRADMSHADLAAQVGASTASCWRRIKALEAAGILGPAVRLVDPVKIGRALDAICQVRMKNHSADARASFDAFVADHPEVMDCYSTSGEWDYLLHVTVADVADYERFLMQELLNHPSVATSSSHFALKRVKYSTALPV